MIKLLLMLLGSQSAKLMFLHRPCGSARTLARDEQEDLIREARQSSIRVLKRRVATFFPLSVVGEDNPLVCRAWEVISLAL